ncbi:DinB family protein [Actinopolymorpha alba]|uniref:DinB family protein n=1 Tax=Actinopolymorpha alba TaxID=533267 RepID=UPI000379A661|nr:DinB family protein [Actinopolymorpha alba]
MDATEQITMIKNALHRSLQDARRSVLGKLTGLGEHSLRRPMTPTGTNLLGVVKHLGSLEYGYLGEVFGRPAPEPMRWNEDGSVWHNGDMWARADESSAYILGFYRRACAHADETVASLDLDAPGSVPWWDETMRETTLGAILIHMLDDTLRHAGHIDIVRELIDGRAGTDVADVGNEQWWREYVSQLHAVADAFEDHS